MKQQNSEKSGVINQDRISSETSKNSLAADVFENQSERDTFEKINRLYQENSASKVPDSAIDRQIIAAAHRELTQPNPRQQLEQSWWRRLSLPLYASAIFTFTAIGAHWYWPEPVRQVRMPPGTAPGPVNIDVINQSDEMQKVVAKQQKYSRKKLNLPEQKAIQALPESPQNLQKEPLSQLAVEQKIIDAQTALSAPRELELKDPQVADFNDNQITKIEQTVSTKDPANGELAQEKWAREIIELLKEGEYQAAQQALIAFKKTYPDYPIDEQLEPFRR